MHRLSAVQSLWLHYAGPPGPARWFNATIDRVRQSQHQGTGAPRIAFEGLSDGTRKRTFYADRIVDAREPGGPADLAKIAAECGISKDTIAEALKPNGSGVRTAEHGFDFDEYGAIVGWAMHVPRPFRKALDLLLTEYRVGGHVWREWTQGVPALLQFQAGDVFYDSPLVRRGAWGLATLEKRRGLHVISATPDSARPQRTKADGQCAVEFFWAQDGTIKEKKLIRCVQCDILDMLREGIDAWDAKNVRGETPHAL